MTRIATAPDLYQRYHLAKGDERLELFHGLVDRYGVQSALYPGSFVHVTPSFIIPTVVYADADVRAARFFADPALRIFILRQRKYEREPEIRFHAGDFATAIDETDASFDLLISQYAGFVSAPASATWRWVGTWWSIIVTVTQAWQRSTPIGDSQPSIVGTASTSRSLTVTLKHT